MERLVTGLEVLEYRWFMCDLGVFSKIFHSQCLKIAITDTMATQENTSKQKIKKLAFLSKASLDIAAQGIFPWICDRAN